MDRKTVEDFMAQRTLALVGVSRKGKKFGNSVLKELTAKGYKVLPVHPVAESIDGVKCWPDLKSLPEPVGGLVIVVPPAQTEKVVEEAALAGIKRVWMQQGSQSPAALRYCAEHGISAIANECILMFAEPVASIHRVHRGLWRLLGKLPK